MRRRDVITLLGAAAAAHARPLAAHAQQQRMRRIGVLMALAADDPEAQVRVAGFLQGLERSGWSVGRNVQIEYRWAGRSERYRKCGGIGRARADILFANAGSVLDALLKATRTVPIVFVGVIDPVGAGRVASLARPGGNATGFFQYRIRHQCEMVGAAQAVSAHVKRAAVIRDQRPRAGSATSAPFETLHRRSGWI